MGDWQTWLVLGGRGAGKTRAGAEWILHHLRQLGPSAIVGVGAPTYADARDVCAEGPSGLITLARAEFPVYNRSLLEARHAAGGLVKFLGSDDPARWNGRQWTALWADELALWRQDSWDQAQFGLRLGADPRAVATTTPKARQWVKALSESPFTAVSHATTAENPHLAEGVRSRLYARFAGTRLGRQELEAAWLDDVPGALWTHARLEANRVDDVPPLLLRVVVAVDPSGGSTEGHSECGIVAAGKGSDGHGYILRDVSEHLSPEQWARRAVQLYAELEADRVVAESNYGGEMVAATIRTVDAGVPVKLVTASRGKRIRAEPVAALDEQGRLHVCGTLPTLEDQLCSWVPDSGDPSPDRLDALVWAITELLVKPERRFTAL